MKQWMPLVMMVVVAGACGEGEPAPQPSTSSSGAGGSALRCFKDEDGDGAIDADDCGGPDTCDRDDRVYPGQQSYFAEETLCGGYDFNADGVEESQYGARVCEFRAGVCTEVQRGWAGGASPPCGEEGVLGCLPEEDPSAEDGELCGQVTVELVDVARCR